MITPLISEPAKRLLDAMMAHVPSGIAVVSAPDLTIVKISDVGSRDLGRCRTDIEGKSLLGEDLKIYREGSRSRAGIDDLPVVRAARDGESVVNEEWIVERADGTQVTVCVNAGPVRDESGVIVGGIAAWADITRQKETEAALRIALENEGMLLREANHRIKNHLQIVAGLVQAESAHLGDEATQLAESVLSRLSVLAAAHEGFYTAKAVGTVEGKPLLNGIARALQCQLHPIAVAVEGDVTFSDTQVTPVSLAVNEAISNARKHAYPSGEAGPIHIDVRRVNGNIEIQVSDKGIGLSNPPREGALGLKILSALAHQLGGSFSLANRPEGGTVFHLAFPAIAPCL